MAQAPTKEERYLADFQAFEQGLESGEGDWVRPIRRQAIEWFKELGFPTARRGNEKWKYTSVVPVANATFEYPFQPTSEEPKRTDLIGCVPWHPQWISLVFVDGRYSEALSTPHRENGVRVSNLAEVVRDDGAVAREHLSHHAHVEDDAFVALNTAFLKDGAFVHVPDGDFPLSTVHLLYLTTDRTAPVASYPRSLVIAGRDSRLKVIESHVSLSDASHFTDAVTEIVLGDGAQVEHYKVLVDSPEAFHVGVTRVDQGQDSVYSSLSFARGASLARNDLQVTLDAPGSACHLKGLYMTSGDQHIDNYINVDHAQPHTTSRLYYKGILDGSSKAVFGGTVLVRQDAQKADSQQSDKNLLLSEQAEVDSKPSLLIYADDVKCSHGATAGNIDEDTLFYMRSRGLDLDAASRLLIHGFAAEIIDAVEIEGLRAYLERLTLESLPNFRFGGTP